MALKKCPRKSVYKNRRYWYHVSTTLKHKHERLVPWDEDRGFNRGGYEPDGKRICVSPTIEQCITAIPYILNTKCFIYRTQFPAKASSPYDVFDAEVTHEGWIHNPTTFIKIGKLNI